MIDERALVAAQTAYAYGNDHGERLIAPDVPRLRKAIEAYEAAKQNAAQGAGDARQAAREDKPGAS